MDIKSIPVPAVYKEESSDFRFFMRWFELALSKIQRDTEEFFDLYDPLRCPAELLWMLGDTMGYTQDTRMSTAFNRLVLVYFMSMIRLKGSRDGVTLAAQVNLDQFKLKKYAEENSILSNRLEDTSIPSNSVYVQPHVEDGYIDLVYFSDQVPVDTCTEYVRPIGMYMVPHAGVRYDAETGIGIDVRLTDKRDIGISIGSTHVGHYSYDDYSRMQRLQISDLADDFNVKDTEGRTRDERNSGYPSDNLSDTREPVWFRNSKYEGKPDPDINPGYRALYSLQLVNGDPTLMSLISGLGLGSISPENVSVFNDETCEVYDQKYYEEQYKKRRRSYEYVEPHLMGSLGDAMVSTNNNENK